MVKKLLERFIKKTNETEFIVKKVIKKDNKINVWLKGCNNSFNN